MPLKTQRFMRKALYVDAIQVTASNMDAVAEWCNGAVHPAEEGDPHVYVKVDVIRPQRIRQTQAYANDWVLRSNGGAFKVYTPKAFKEAFLSCEPATEGVLADA